MTLISAQSKNKTKSTTFARKLSVKLCLLTCPIAPTLKATSKVTKQKYVLAFYKSVHSLFVINAMRHAKLIGSARLSSASRKSTKKKTKQKTKPRMLTSDNICGHSYCACRP